jgi:pantetheine-phosphate adenylyltransferase
VGLGENPAKTYLLPREVRLDLLREICAALPNVTVSAYDGLLVDFCRSIGAGVIVRGLRAVTDFEFEFQVGLANRDLAPGVETVFLLPEPRFIFISSSIVREIFQMGGDVEPYVPPASLRAMKTWATPRFPRPRP